MVVILPHCLFPLDFFITPHQLLLLLDLSYLLIVLVFKLHILHLLQRSLHRHLLLDGLDSLLFKHPVIALLHKEVMGGQGVGEQLVVLVRHFVGRHYILEQRC